VLVKSPLISLKKDQFTSLAKLNVQAAFYGEGQEDPLVKEGVKNDKYKVSLSVMSYQLYLNFF